MLTYRTLGPQAPILMLCIELGHDNIYLTDVVIRSPICLFIKNSSELGIVVHTWSLCRQEAEAEGSGI